MPELTQYHLHTTPGETTGEQVQCPAAYSLRGPQVGPEASWWLDCFNANGCPAPHPITVPELVKKLGLPFDPAKSYDPKNPKAFPTDSASLDAEIEELIILARLRDESIAIAHVPATDDQRKEPQQLRLPLTETELGISHIRSFQK
jgi:hypothetical protein